jgi:hypothetical protein
LGLILSSFSEKETGMIQTRRIFNFRTAAFSGMVLTAVFAMVPAAQAQNFTVSDSYAYTGGLQTFTDPIGVTSIFVTLSGAGGGGFVFSNPGGNGALVSGFLSVTPGNIYDILVGGGGATYGAGDISLDTFGGGGGGGSSDDADGAAAGGAGGGRSAIQASQGIDLADAGGGGGSGTITGGNGGFIGGSSTYFGGSGGTSGGSQTAGGMGSSSGVGHQGGIGMTPPLGGGAGGGGGGGGYFGGGGGYGGGPSTGGGGGSSLLPNSTFSVVDGGGGSGGIGASDIYIYPGVTPATNGSDGFITIQYNSPAAVPEMSSAFGLGTGLLGLSLFGLRLRRKNAA